MSAHRIAVVGGSLTGPATALFLQRAGFDCQLYEAVPAAVSLAGGVIGLEHPALAALEEAGIDQDEVVPITSERVVSIRVLNHREADRVQTIYPGRTTTWTLLNGALRSRLAPGTYHSGKRVQDVRSSSQGPATLLFSDGSDITADVVIFADGRKSTGRRLLDPKRRLRYAGYVAHRGSRQDCPPELFDAFMRFEPVGTQFTTFPAVTELGVQLDWTFYLDTPSQLFAQHFGDTPTNRTFIFPKHVTSEARRYVDDQARRRLPDCQARVVATTPKRMAAPVIDIDAPTQMVFSLGGDAVGMLIGDALAPVRPHTGRGANNGIEQAHGLAQALRQHSRWGADRDAALDAWQRRHLPDVVAAVRRGPEIGARLGLGKE